MTSRSSSTCTIVASILFVSSLTLSSVALADTPEWANTLKNMGNVYSGDDGSVVQSVKVFGRAHGQWNYSDGDSAGDSFNGSGEELRRLRAGASVSFLDGFKALARLNLEEGGFGNTRLSFESWDELYLEYGQKNWLGFDSASVGYGRYKLLFGGEEHQSSKRIKTIERSAINNRFGSRRPTGLKINAEKDGVEYILGIWSREPEPKGWATGLDEGLAVQGSATFEALDGEWILDFVYADDEDSDDTIFDYDWASSVTYNRDFGRIGLLTNLTFSQAGDVDPLGIVILPTYDITDKLEAAFRYQWANSSADTGVPRSSSSRGIRRVARGDGVSTGSGDNYHAVYAGLNYYIAGDNVKLMSGLEYETIRGDSDTELDGVTFWLAARLYF